MSDENKRSVRRPKPHELMFMQAFVKGRVDGRCVQIGDHPQEILTAAEARRLAAWLVCAAEWIEGQGK